jgi:hypothetical protein
MAANWLLQIFKQIVVSAGLRTPEVNSSTPGGGTLAKHLAVAESMMLIDEGRWGECICRYSCPARSGVRALPLPISVIGRAASPFSATEAVPNPVTANRMVRPERRPPTATAHRGAA